MAQNQIRLFRLSRKPIGEPAVSATLDEQERRVFRSQDLQKLFQQHRDEWGILSPVTWKSFLEFLENDLGLKKITLKGPKYQQRFVRYLWREPTALEVAASLRSTAYLCHASAVFVHGLTRKLPSILYVNYEQSEKPKPTGELTQANVDRAFRSKQRESAFAFAYEKFTIVLLSGKNTDHLEVQNLSIASGIKAPVTSLERTLIDIAVRPAYAGGVQQVLDAYRRAKAKVSIPKLLATLHELDHVYPYHQAIGFYMERAGYPRNQLSRLKDLGLDLTFYLAHNMREKERNDSWRLYHPKGM